MAKETIKERVNDPPYERNGNGTPVKGITPNKPPKLTRIWRKIYTATPSVKYLPLIVFALLDKLKILPRTTI